MTVTDQDGHAIGHGCARPEPKSHARRRDKHGKPGPPGDPDPPRGTSDTTGPGFSFTASGQHGPPGGYGTWRLRTRGHGPDLIIALDFEHNTPYEAGGRTCLCNGGPKYRHDHRLKQHPRWHVDQLPDSTFRWTTPSGRQYTTEPTRYPI